MMFTRWFEKTQLSLEERAIKREAIQLWDNGSPQGNLREIREMWPIDLWTELLRQKKIRINDVDLDRTGVLVKTEALANIKDKAFWEVVASYTHEDDPKWPLWLGVAMSVGNIDFLNVYPKRLTSIDLMQASSHPKSRHWVLNHPTYAEKKPWRDIWYQMSYKSNVRDYMIYGFDHDELFQIIQDNIQFEGQATAINAFNTYMDYFEERPQQRHTYQPVLKKVWGLTNNPVPFEVMMSIYGGVPQESEVAPALYEDCTSVAKYGLGHGLWTASTLHTFHANTTSLDVYLNMTQPSNRNDLIESLTSYYSSMTHHVETLPWDAAFGEIHD